MDVIILISRFLSSIFCDVLLLYHVGLDNGSYPSKIITVFDNLQDGWMTVSVFGFNTKNTVLSKRPLFLF